MVARPADADDAANRCGEEIEVWAWPIDDSWVRDTGPTFLVDDGGGSVAIDWVFNGWGGKARQTTLDDALAGAVAARLGLPTVRTPLVMEGGALCCDGQGTLLVTEQCLLNPNRNPDLDRSGVERCLQDLLQVDAVIWLPFGLSEDTDTDGHVDNVACFARPGVVLMVSPPDDPAHPDNNRLRAAARVLRDARDARGRLIEVIPLPHVCGTLGPDGRILARSYANFFIANGGVVMPGFGLESDAAALNAVRAAFPGRDVVMMPEGNVVARGGGNIHCITLHQPRAL
jgi:agmatine deiminase